MGNLPLIKILFLTTFSFVLTILWTPLVTHILYAKKLGKQIRSKDAAPIASTLHTHKSGTPAMGGVLIWGTTLVLSLLFFYINRFSDNDFLRSLNFLTRRETLLPLGALVASALVGLFDDYLNVRKIGPYGGGLSIRYRLVMYTAIAAVASWWFFYKLEWSTLYVPFVGSFEVGWWYIPIFIVIIVATSFSVNETDGLDGLAGGVLLLAFVSYGAIAFAEGRTNLAAFCWVIAGALLAFLWFNIPPARFFMGDTGAMSLGVTLGIVAMLTNAIFLLPLIGFILVVESGSVLIQVTSKRLFGRKVFLSSPIHHHLEASGWPEAKIVMRFWIISGIMCALALMLFLLDRGL